MFIFELLNTKLNFFHTTLFDNISMQLKKIYTKIFKLFKN